MTAKLSPDANTPIPIDLPQQKDAFTSEGAPPPGKVSTDVPVTGARRVPDKPRRKRTSAARYP